MGVPECMPAGEGAVGRIMAGAGIDVDHIPAGEGADGGRNMGGVPPGGRIMGGVPPGGRNMGSGGGRPVGGVAFGDSSRPYWGEPPRLPE